MLPSARRARCIERGDSKAHAPRQGCNVSVRTRAVTTQTPCTPGGVRPGHMLRSIHIQLLTELQQMASWNVRT
jgi:hypothetical protein